MTNGDLADRVAGIAALADPIRRDLYLYVSAQSAPVSRDQASDALGIARHTAKFHLDKLAEEGLLDTSFKRLSERRGPGGRPAHQAVHAIRPAAVGDAARTPIRPRRPAPGQRHRRRHCGRHRRRRRLERGRRPVGQHVGDQARATAGPRPEPERLIASTCQALTDCGYAPHRAGDTILLSNCPFDALAQEHTQLICGMNLAIMAAVTDRVGQTGLAARLEPAPNRCCVVLGPGS